jgi:transcriptional regulator with XRE-family HTH domain
MQAVSYIQPNGIYSWDMRQGRPAQTKRPALGERIAHARQQAGLTQAQLAQKLSTTQRVVTYWEREAVSLKPEQLAALAVALDVSADVLLGLSSAKQRGTGPVGKARRLFDAISRLPRHQQEKIITILEPFVREHVKAA